MSAVSVVVIRQKPSLKHIVKYDDSIFKVPVRKYSRIEDCNTYAFSCQAQTVCPVAVNPFFCLIHKNALLSVFFTLGYSDRTVYGIKRMQ